ncbi:MAG: O-antigen ligase family protein [Acidobacteriota bacterium]
MIIFKNALNILSISLIFAFFLLFPPENKPFSLILIPLLLIFFFILKKEILIPKFSEAFLFFSLIIFSFFFNNKTFFSLEFFSYFLIIISTYILLINSEKKTLLIVFEFTAISIIIYGFLQKFFLFDIAIKEIISNQNLNEFFKNAALIRLQSGRVFSTFSLPTALAAFLTVTILISLGRLFSQSTRKLSKFFPIIIILLSFPLIMFTQSFGAAFELGTGLFAFYILSEKRKNKNLILFLFIVIVISFIILIERFSSFHEESPLFLRLSNWRVAAQIFLSSPFFGIGLGNYGIGSSLFTLGGESFSKYAHNVFLHIFAETGALGGILFIGIIFSWLFSKIKNSNNSSKDELFYLSTFFAFLAYNLIDIGIFFPGMGFLGAFLLSILNKNQNYVQLNKLSRKIFILLVILISVFSIWINVSNYLNSLAEERLMNRNNDSALSILNASNSINPYNPKTFNKIAEIMFQKGDLENSYKYLKRAIDLDPNSFSLYRNFFNLSLQRKELIEAYLYIYKAERLFPSREEFKKERLNLQKFLIEEIKKK